jgi:hypothetical protein
MRLIQKRTFGENTRIPGSKITMNRKIDNPDDPKDPKST